jgi:hypothetical protein
VVWISSAAQGRSPRLTLAECPVSYVTGESAAWLEEFYAYLMFPSGVAALEWAARRVDAFAVLLRDLREMEKSQHG